MKFALISALAFLCAGSAMSHDTTCVPPGFMVLPSSDGNLELVNKKDGRSQPFYATPNCQPLVSRGEALLGTSGTVLRSLISNEVLTKLEPAAPTDISTLRIWEVPSKLPATQVVTVTETPTVTNNYYGDVYYNSSVWSGWSWRDAYAIPPFTLTDLAARCINPPLDMLWADRALSHYYTHYSYYQRWRIWINWNDQQDFVEACQIFSAPRYPLPIQ